MNDQQMQLFNQTITAGTISTRLARSPSTDYGAFVQKLASSTIHDDQVPVVVLKSLIYSALRGSDALDEARKSLFYGKPSHAVMAHRALLGESGQEYVEGEMDLIHAILGIRNEADEMLRLLLKVLNGEAVKHADFVDETGDVLWFVQLLANYVNCSIADMIAANVAKLKVRYPDGFDEERAANPDKVQEMKTIAMTEVTSPTTT